MHENKSLGVTIGDKLSWKPHIIHVKYKIARNTAVINKAKQVLDDKSLHTLYYCTEVWGNIYSIKVHYSH